MSNALILIEHAAGQVKKSSLSAITFGQKYIAHTSGELHLLVIGKEMAATVDSLTGYGAIKVHVLDHPSLGQYSAESYSLAVEKVAKATGSTMVGAVSSSLSKDLLPKVSVKLEAGMASDVMSIVSADSFTRPMWAGNVIATVKITTPIKVATIRGTDFDVPATSDKTSEVAAHDFTTDPSTHKTQFVSLQAVSSERPDVTTADIVVSGGRGVKSAEGFKVIEQLADQLGAGIGASRAVCDAGWTGNDLQIGQTGKVVAPNLYFAIGISGAIQHIAGMKSSKTIVAINKDPEAPIFQIADYGLVADLFTAVPELMTALK